MSEEYREADEWAAALDLDAENVTITGDPEEALAEAEGRIAELEAALEDLDTLDPQRGLVNLELGTLRAFRDVLRDRVDDQEDGS